MRAQDFPRRTCPFHREGLVQVHAWALAVLCPMHQMNSFARQDVSRSKFNTINTQINDFPHPPGGLPLCFT